MIELIGARKYYGRHATGTVVVADGHPVFHGTREEAAAFRRTALLRRYEATSNGVRYDWDFAGPDGAAFVLFREPHHTDEDIATAKREIYNDRDVVSLSVAKMV